MFNNLLKIIKNSFFVKLVLKTANIISGCFKKSLFYSFFTKHNMQDYAQNSKIVSLIKNIKFFDFVKTSKIISAVVSLPKYVISTPIRVFSFYLLPSSLTLFCKYFGDIPKMIVFAALTIFATILFRFNFTVSDFINSSRILKSFCSFFEIKTDYPINTHTKRVYALALVTGAICGIACLLFDFKTTILLFFVFLFFPLLLDSPLLLICLTVFSGIVLSTLPATVFSILTFLVVVCRIIKQKEKILPIRPINIFVFLYAVVVFYHMLFNYGGKDSTLAAGIQLVLMLLFFSVVTVINNAQKFKKLIFAISASSIVTSVYGLYQFIFNKSGTGWSDNTNFDGGLGRITSTFSNPNIYGEFLIIIICITLVSFFLCKSKLAKAFNLICFVLQLVNLALTYSRGCYIAVVIAILIVVWYFNKKLLWFGVLALPVIPYVLPQNMLTRILSMGDYLKDTSVTYRQNIWTASLNIIKNHWYVGSGVGSTAFTAFYQQYMYPGIEAQHSHNWFMQLTIELSVVGLALLLLIFIFTLKDISNAVKNSSDKNIKLILIPLIAAFVGLMFEGLVDYIFYNNIVFMCFWLLLALIVCSLNIFQEVSLNEKV